MRVKASQCSSMLVNARQWGACSCFLILPILAGLPSYLLAGSLASQSLFYPFLLSGLEIEGVFLGFFYDVFLQNLALKTSQCVFNGFAFVYLNIRHLVFFALGWILIWPSKDGH